MAVRECDRFGAYLSAYVDGELTPARSAEIERHLLTCADCKRRHAELRDLAQSLAALPRLAAPPGLATEVRRAISRGDAAHRSETPRPWWVGLLNARAGAAAAVFALALFTAWLAWSPVASRWDAQEELRRTFPPAAPSAETPAPPEGPARGDGLVSTAQPERAVPPAAHVEPPSQPPVAAPPAISAVKPPELRVAARDTVSDSPSPPTERSSPFRANSLEVTSIAADAPNADVPAAMEVVIAPRTAAEYDAILQLLGTKLEAKAQAQGLPVAAGGAAAAEPRRDAEEIEKRPAGGGGGASSVTSANDGDLPRVFSVRSSSARDLLLALAEAAPGNVDVRLEFGADAVTQVQRMFDSAPAAEDPAPPAAIADGADGALHGDEAKDNQAASDRTARGQPRERALAEPSAAKETETRAAGGGAATNAPPGAAGPAPTESASAPKPGSDANAPPVAGRGGARGSENKTPMFRMERRMMRSEANESGRAADLEGRPAGEDDAPRAGIDLSAAIEPLRWLAAGATEFAGDVFSVGRAVIQPPAATSTNGGILVRVVIMPVGARGTDAFASDSRDQQMPSLALPTASQPATRGAP